MIPSREQLYCRLAELAEADNITLNRNDLRRKLNRYSVEDLCRVVDAVERFGFKIIYDYIKHD